LIRRVTVFEDASLSGLQLIALSGDGRFVLASAGVWREEGNYSEPLFWIDVDANSYKMLTSGCVPDKPISGYGWKRELSSDGRYVFFNSWDIDLADGEFLPSEPNLYRWDSVTEQLVLITPNKFLTGGSSGVKHLEAVSADGSMALIEAYSNDLACGGGTFGAVFVWRAGAPPPVLSIAVREGLARVSWPSNPYDSVLEVRSGGGSWVRVTRPIQEHDGIRFVEQPIASDSNAYFFRLRPPE